MQTRNILI